LTTYGMLLARCMIYNISLALFTAMQVVFWFCGWKHKN